MTTHCWCDKALTADQIRRGNRYCSRSHGSQFARQRQMPLAIRRSWIAKANETRRRAYVERVVSAIANDLRPHAEKGMVELAVAVKIAVKYRRQGYERGWAANYARRMRAAS